MLNSFHYKLRTVSQTGDFINAMVSYDVYFDIGRGIAYEVELQAPVSNLSREMRTAWHAKIVNPIDGHRLEYDYLQKIYYQSRQTVQVEAAFYRLEEDLLKFLRSGQGTAVGDITINGKTYPGYRLNTLTIWFDPENFVPVRRENMDRGNLISDEFEYDSLNAPIPANVFQLPKPAEAVADFNLYPEPPTLPRFETTCATPAPVAGVYVDVLLEELKRHIILNQWEYGPFSTIKLPWLTEMPATIYQGKTPAIRPPLVVVLEPPGQAPVRFFVTYDFLGYVVTGFTQDPYDLSNYTQVPVTTSIRLVDLVPLYAAPSPEKDFVVNNFITSVQSNDTFIEAFDLGGKTFPLMVKNFSFHENEGYVLLDIYGKEYWDNANLEAMFDYVTTGQMADVHTTPIIIYASHVWKRLGIYQDIRMPVYHQV
ncbi:MAG TPA: hypothetical protein VHY08_08890 [Bacillota bacterium]|nr:hypothetical protein [Bacillota bacterium]